MPFRRSETRELGSQGQFSQSLTAMGTLVSDVSKKHFIMMVRIRVSATGNFFGALSMYQELGYIPLFFQSS